VNNTHYINSRVLKLNVGYLLTEGPGHSRENELDVPSHIRVSDDLLLDYLRGPLRLSRTSRGILVQGALNTRVHGECVRCLEEAAYEMEIPLEELYVHPPEPGAEFVVDDTGILDLAPLLREETILAMPKHLLCREDCRGLCLQCGANLNYGPCDCDMDDIDPRFAALKALKEQLNQDRSDKSIN
jgi:uncharacterized protein